MKTLPNVKVQSSMRSHVQTEDGLTKREYFAATIAAGLVGKVNGQHVASDAVKLADELINELNKEKEAKSE